MRSPLQLYLQDTNSFEALNPNLVIKKIFLSIWHICPELNGQIARVYPKLQTARTPAPNFGAGVLTDARAGLAIAINTFEIPATVTIPTGFTHSTVVCGSTVTTAPVVAGSALAIPGSSVLLLE